MVDSNPQAKVVNLDEEIDISRLPPQEVLLRAASGTLEITPGQFMRARRESLGLRPEFVASNAYMGIPIADYLAMEADEMEVPDGKKEVLKSALRCRQSNGINHLFCNVMGTRYRPAPERKDPADARPRLLDPVGGQVDIHLTKGQTITPDQVVPAPSPYAAIGKGKQAPAAKPTVTRAGNAGESNKDIMARAIAGEEELTQGEFLTLRFDMQPTVSLKKIEEATGISKADFKAMMADRKKVPEDKVAALKAILNCETKYSALFDKLFGAGQAIESAQQSAELQSDGQKDTGADVVEDTPDKPGVFVTDSVLAAAKVETIEPTPVMLRALKRGDRYGWEAALHQIRAESANPVVVNLGTFDFATQKLSSGYDVDYRGFRLDGCDLSQCNLPSGQRFKEVSLKDAKLVEGEHNAANPDYAKLPRWLQAAYAGSNEAARTV